jgi:hypothetical protein
VFSGHPRADGEADVWFEAQSLTVHMWSVPSPVRCR